MVCGPAADNMEFVRVCTWAEHRVSDRLERMRRNPVGDWTIRDVEADCREYAVVCEPAGAAVRIYKVAHAEMAEKLTIPYKRPIKAVYIRKLVAFIDAVRKPQ